MKAIDDEMPEEEIEEEFQVSGREPEP